MKKEKKENVLAVNVRFSKKLKKGKKAKKDLSKVEYYGYREKGHYKNRYPNKEQVVMIGEGIPDHNE